MGNGILESVKKLIGIAPEYTSFDEDILVFINSSITVLKQLGVNIDPTYYVEGYDATWDDFPDDQTRSLIKEYIFLKSKVVFDPPTSSIVLDAYKQAISELEWRINVDVDKKENGDERQSINPSRN